ncbi:unnamed protein product [Periconia digitata]|uniref:Uncharacterized protein n=1 Tax=Periconia digitata TaxID=1303443 RepID=A0A9W4UGB6_9PLEO|nr:unnamed protein product [Periconia digitata]
MRMAFSSSFQIGKAVVRGVGVARRRGGRGGSWKSSAVWCGIFLVLVFLVWGWEHGGATVHGAFQRPYMHMYMYVHTYIHT